MKISFFIALFLLSTTAIAADKNNNIKLGLALGKPNAQIQNPDGSTAYYEGTAINLSLVFPISTAKNFDLNVNSNFRYLNLTNTTVDRVKETAQLSGPGLGLEASFYIFRVGYGFNYLNAKHQSVGVISKELGYKLLTNELTLGLQKRFERVSLEFSYTHSSGSISGSETGLSSNSKFDNTVYWLGIKIDLGTSFSKLNH